MTPRQFAAHRRGIAEREQREWERARYTAYLAMLPHVPSKRRLRITDLGRFPWEKVKKPVFEEQSAEVKANFEKMKAMLKEQVKRRV